MSNAVLGKVRRMRRQGFKVWAIAAACGLSYNQVAKALSRSGESLLILDHPREQRKQTT